MARAGDFASVARRISLAVPGPAPAGDSNSTDVVLSQRHGGVQAITIT